MREKRPVTPKFILFAMPRKMVKKKRRKEEEKQEKRKRAEAYLSSVSVTWNNFFLLVNPLEFLTCFTVYSSVVIDEIIGFFFRLRMRNINEAM